MAPDIFKFQDYRAYLKELLEHLKVEKKISQRKLSKVLDVSPAIFTMIIKGKRKLGEKLLLDLSSFLNFNDSQKAHLESLVLLNDSIELTQKGFALNSLAENKEFATNHPQELETYKYLSHWENVAIREMTRLKDFKLSTSWIRKRLIKNVSVRDIKKRLDFLIKNNFLSQKDGGIKYVADKHLSCREGVFKLSLGQFHSKMLELASDSIGEVPSKDRKLLAHTVAMSEENFEKSKEIIEKALNDIKALEKNDIENTRVFHAEFALFPLTKRPEDTD
ncbi:MAG: hypothetical protein CME70_10560 [Halobacteriovorax sp.]|nr:hypothetical protein [Halobacteriovorax sp.]|tara:strand:- start:108049 stop:108879 length:831 start_codon:yes stop_codon:yes gene_type:complete